MRSSLLPESTNYSEKFSRVSALSGASSSPLRGDWSPASWRGYPAEQQPEFADSQNLRAAITQINKYPPLVSSGEISELRRQLAEAEVGRRFLLQGGDCAERFADCTPEAIGEKVRLLLRMGLVLTARLGVPVIKVGRIAGQYAKPRSRSQEPVGGTLRPSFRGDSVHDIVTRTADPMRLVQAYHAASLTLNYIRSLMADGLTSLSRCPEWARGNEPESYFKLVARVQDALNVVHAYGAKPSAGTSIDGGALSSASEIFASHEGLILEFEEAMTRYDPLTGKAFNLSAHTLWIGERTRSLCGAHVEYFRGIANPVGVKIGPGADPSEIAALVRLLNPERERGKLLLVSRLGVDNVAGELPAIIKSVNATKTPVVWVCDPMHGNTFTTDANIKSRAVEDIISEYAQTSAVHKATGSRLAGIHLEMTGDAVTECIGSGVQLDDLMINYQTYCDPRLNGIQSLRVASEIAIDR